MVDECRFNCVEQLHTIIGSSIVTLHQIKFACHFTAEAVGIKVAIVHADTIFIASLVVV
jgi:hypothetical protein